MRSSMAIHRQMRRQAGFDDAFLYEEVKRPLEQRRIPAVNLLREKAISNFEAWRKYAGRIDY